MRRKKLKRKRRKRKNPKLDKKNLPRLRKNMMTRLLPGRRHRRKKMRLVKLLERRESRR